MKKPKIKFNRMNMCIPCGRGKKFIDYKDVIVIESDGAYSKIIAENNPELYVYDSLVEMITYLPLAFFKCNRSQIINLSFVSEYKTIANNMYAYINRLAVKISKSNKNEFIDMLEVFKEKYTICFHCPLITKPCHSLEETLCFKRTMPLMDIP